MKPSRSILRQAVGAVLLLELLAASVLIVLTAVHERHARHRAFHARLEAKAASVLGAVGDANDETDAVVLDPRGVALGPGEFFEAREGAKLLGRGGPWPVAPAAGVARDSRGSAYEVAGLGGVRVVDPDEPGGGKAHRVEVLYGGPLAPVEAEAWAVVRFQAAASAAVLLGTALALAWFLRRALDPLRELAEAAAKLSARSLRFEAPPSAGRTRELAPLSAAIGSSVERLERSFAQQRRLTGDAAHELKTDVAIIKSSLQLLLLRERTPEGYRDGLARALGDCERMEADVGAMLTLARVEYVPAAEAEWTDLGAAAAAAAAALAPLAELHGVCVRLDCRGKAPVRLSRRDAGLLCTNLLENALRHGPASSEVAVTTAETGGEVTLTVQDRGEGIPAEALPHIFEAFYRGDEARDRKHGGAGLGLAIARAICERAGGALRAESRPGKGTTMLARMPSASGQAAPVPAASRPKLSEG